MRRIATEDLSGFEKYLNADKTQVKIPRADCLLIDKCLLSSDQTLGLIKVGNRLLLLSHCGTGDGYVYCATETIIALDYTSLEEALVTYWNESSKRMIRDIDDLAYGLYCDLYR